MTDVRLRSPVASRAGELREVAPVVRSIGRGVTRAIGVATAPIRPLPHFLIIGAKRGGTTSLYSYLLEHPRVAGLFPSARHLPLRAERKGVHYFDERFRSGRHWYRSNFPSQAYRRLVGRRVGGPIVSGEATPYYLFHPHAAARARLAVPHARIIVLLRNPTDRAYSHYQEQRRRGHEHLATFEEAIEAEPLRLAGEQERLERDPAAVSFAHEHQSYVAQGHYLESLEPWLRNFPSCQIHIARSEDMYADPQSTYDQILDFLGLPAFVLPHPEPLNGTFAAPIPAGLRDRLDAHYAPHNAALEERLQRSFGWVRP